MEVQTISLGDGRTFAFAEWGDPQGKPLFLISGTSSRLLCPPQAALQEHGLRTITIDKPGIGYSTAAPGHTIQDVAADVVTLANSLGFARFAVMGGSQGGPYACALAYQYPERLTTLTLVSPLTPFEVKGLNRENSFFLRLFPVLANRAPWLLYQLYKFIGWSARRNPQSFARQIFNNLPKSDQAILIEQGMADVFGNDMLEVVRNGTGGAADDVRAVARPWGFSPADIRVPTFLWQGENDPNVTPRMGRYFAETIPDCHATFVPGAGHMMIFSHWREIVAQVAEHFVRSS
jgi:pimeloyl-ACP methyl ester carboxylesterase